MPRANVRDQLVHRRAVSSRRHSASIRRCKIDQGVPQVEAEAAKLFRATQIPDFLSMDYGKALRIGRAIAGLQQRELAELAEIDPSHNSLIEVGKRKPSSSARGSCLANCGYLDILRCERLFWVHSWHSSVQMG